MAEDGRVYVVEYDIPESPRLRMRFYRRLRKLLGKGIAKYSTQSVVVTPDRSLAETVFQTALEVSGRVRLYEAKLLRDYQLVIGVTAQTEAIP